MKLRKYINSELVRNGDSVIPMFGLERERWDELADAVIAFFDAGGKISETFERFDDYIELKDDQEITAVIYMFGVEKGRFEGEQMTSERGAEAMRHGRIGRVIQSAEWFKERGIALTDYLRRFMSKVKSHGLPHVHVKFGRGLESLIATIIQDMLGERGNSTPPRFSNKNKFKKDDFDIPDPNKKSDSRGDEPSKES